MESNANFVGHTPPNPGFGGHTPPNPGIPPAMIDVLRGATFSGEDIGHIEGHVLTVMGSESGPVWVLLPSLPNPRLALK